MTHASGTHHPASPRNPLRRRRPGAPRSAESVVTDLREVLARAHHLDPALLRARPAEPVATGARLQLLGATPLHTGADALGRLEALARELVARMQAAGWDEGAAPSAVTSVLAASVPEAESVLLRAARSRGR